MPSALETHAALKVLTNDAVGNAAELFNRTHGKPDERRLQMLDTVPALISYYTDGSSALAADFYEDTRAAAKVKKAFVAAPIVLDRTVKIRSAIAWAAAPLFDGDQASPVARLAEVVQYETARPFRDTILTNRRDDRQAVGWQRVTSGGCGFCQMLADNGAVYTEESADFAAHTNCNCTAEPVFRGQDHGPEASVQQYRASSRNRSPKQQKELREYLERYYPTDPSADHSA